MLYIVDQANDEGSGFLKTGIRQLHKDERKVMTAVDLFQENALIVVGALIPVIKESGP